MFDNVTKVQGAAELAVSLTTINNWIRRGLLPEPIRISPVCVMWTREAFTKAADQIRKQPWYQKLQRQAESDIRETLARIA